MTKGSLGKLLIIQEQEPYGICRGCGQKFIPENSYAGEWRTQIILQFDAHQCKREDAKEGVD
jgi:hypothetical protein